VRSNVDPLGVTERFPKIMAYAINIRSHNNSSQPIRALWEECSRLESSPSMETLNYPPHITFAIYEDVRPSELFNAFDSAFDRSEKLEIRFESLGYFEAPHAIILWAAPNPSKRIASIHDQIHSRIDVNLCHLNYRPGSWVPHFSLATAIDPSRKNEAIAFAKRPINPIDVVFDVADCASFLSVEVLREKALSSDA